jgi:hypothetical protein
LSILTNSAEAWSIQRVRVFTLQSNTNPSRYIKDLSDRIAFVEGQLRQEGPVGSRPSAPETSFAVISADYSQPASYAGVKRNRSMTGELDDQYTASQRTGFPPEEPSQSPEADVQVPVTADFQMDDDFFTL